MHIELSTGSVEYESSGEGTPLVLLHGAFMNASLWDHVVDELRTDFRCVVPVLPLGGHTRPMPDADLSPAGVAAMVGELIERLDLNDVTLAGVDTGGAIAQLVMTSGCNRVARLALVACDAFDNFPPGLPGKTSALAARVPGGLVTAAYAMRVPGVPGLPVTWGWMAKNPIPRRMLDEWFAPLRSDRGVRADLRRFLRAVGPAALRPATERLPSVETPTLVVWSPEDRVMPPSHADRLAELLPDARVAWVPDSYTLVPLDQPGELADRLRTFVSS